MNVQWVALAIGCALMVALIAMPLGIFTILGSVDGYQNASSNAVTWNATLNGSATGFSLQPLFIIIIVAFVFLGIASTTKGFGGD